MRFMIIVHAAAEPGADRLAGALQREPDGG